MSAEQLKEIEKVGAIDWAIILPLILPLLQSLLNKNDHGIRQGRPGLVASFLSEYTQSFNEMNAKK